MKQQSSNGQEHRDDNVLTVRVRRFNPAHDKEPYWQTYEVPRIRTTRALDILEYIHTELDPTLGYRRHLCRDTVCRGCFVKLNGKPRMTCMTPLAHDLTEITLEPMGGYRHIRDLVVDFTTKLDGSDSCHTTCFRPQLPGAGCQPADARMGSHVGGESRLPASCSPPGVCLRTDAKCVSSGVQLPRRRLA